MKGIRYQRRSRVGSWISMEGQLVIVKRLYGGIKSPIVK